MKSKKIIIILSLIVVFIIVVTIILRSSLNNASNSQSVSEFVDTLPTGIIVPTEQISANELDIISVTPRDGSKNINSNSKIRITFSKSLKESDIEFYISPDISHSQEIQDNILVITPWKPLTEGTLYTYSVNFPDDNQKIRLYRFVTEGRLSSALPDTRPVELIEKVEKNEREQRPDIYITNRTPYENDTFRIHSDFESSPPSHFYFIVTSKISDMQKVKQSLNAWLQSHGLTDAQIVTLDIRYQ